MKLIPALLIGLLSFSPHAFADTVTLPSGDDVCPLSSLDLTTVTYFDDSGKNSVQADKATFGTDLLVRGTTYASGVGTHAPSKFVVKVNGATEFHALFGIDDAAAVNSDGFPSHVKAGETPAQEGGKDGTERVGSGSAFVPANGREHAKAHFFVARGDGEKVFRHGGGRPLEHFHAAHWGIYVAGAGVEQAQIVVNLRYRAYCGAAPARAALLPKGYGGGHTAHDGAGVWNKCLCGRNAFCRARYGGVGRRGGCGGVGRQAQELAGVGREGADIAAHTLCMEGGEGEGAFPAARNA